MAPSPQTDLPYYRDLAEPLPTVEEIHNAAHSGLSPRRDGWGNGGMCVIRGTYLVKDGSRVTENEGNTLLLVEQYPNIPALRLYAMFYATYMESKALYLVMEYISGAVTMESVWKSLPAGNKSSIVSQLQQIFSQIRSLLPPEDFVGDVCGGPVPHPAFETWDPDPAINGPFISSKGIAAALSSALRKTWEERGQRPWSAYYLSRHLPTTLSDYHVKFTHGDLQMRNIMLESVPERKGEYQVRAIVDWENSGYYPEFWEYAAAVARYHSVGAWLENLDEILRPFPLETSDASSLARAGLVRSSLETVRRG